MNKDFNQYLTTLPDSPKTAPAPDERELTIAVGTLINITAQQTELISVLLERAPHLRTKLVAQVIQEVALKVHNLAIGNKHTKGLIA